MISRSRTPNCSQNYIVGYRESEEQLTPAAVRIHSFSLKSFSMQNRRKHFCSMFGFDTLLVTVGNALTNGTNYRNRSPVTLRFILQILIFRESYLECLSFSYLLR